MEHAALGPRKRALGGQLIRKRLHGRFAPGGLLHFGQGKWYPGESLPRWAFGCYWRKDGEPLWNNPALFADEDVAYHLTEEHARRFATRWRYAWAWRRSSSSPATRMPGTTCGKSGACPPTSIRSSRTWRRTRGARAAGARVRAGPEPRRRLRAPVAAREGTGEEAWLAERAVVPAHRAHVPDPGRFADGLPPAARFAAVGGARRLPAPRGARSRGWRRPRCRAARPDAPAGPAARARAPPTGRRSWRACARNALSPPRSSRAALGGAHRDLCVEPRDGRLYVFMPPVRELEDYLDLVPRIEETAAELQMPCHRGLPSAPDDRRLPAQGHARPRRDRGQHPSRATWDELVKITPHVLYEEARQCRLGTEKFMLDGRHTGTGGGNHIVLGGPTPADSPLPAPARSAAQPAHLLAQPPVAVVPVLRPVHRPDQPGAAHRRGPQRLALRARDSRSGRSAAGRQRRRGWWTARFRHLLTDATGNTHRAEFCIDKLYSPDSATGRLGLWSCAPSRCRRTRA
jgi:hypothetical protein